MAIFLDNPNRVFAPDSPAPTPFLARTFDPSIHAHVY
jgi:hypothetical protein